MLLALSGRICYCNSQLAGNTEGSAAAVGVAFLCSNAPLNAGDCTLPTQSVLAQHHCMGVAVLGMAHGDHIVNTDGHTVIQLEHTGVVGHHGELALVGSGQLSVAGGHIQHIDATVGNGNGNLTAVDTDLRTSNSAVIIALGKVCSSCLLDLSSVGQVGLFLIGEPAGNVNVSLLTGCQLAPGGSTGNHTGSSIVLLRGNGALYLHITDSSGDDSSTVTNSGDLTVLIHGGNTLVGRCPQDGPVGCFCGQHSGNQSCLITDPQMLVIAVQQDTADSSAGLNLGNSASYKVKAVQPSIVAVLQNDAIAAVCIVSDRNLHSDGTIAIICDIEHSHAHVVIGSACSDIVDGNILLKTLSIGTSYINSFSAFFNDYLMHRHIFIGIAVQHRSGSDIHQITVLIVLDIQEIAAFVVAADICATGALLTHHDPSHSGGNFCRLLVGGVGVQRQQEVHTVFLRHIHSNGIGGSTVIVQRGDFFPIAVVQSYLHTFTAV